MNRIEQLFNEPTDTGLGKQISDFWAGFDDVANHPDDAAPACNSWSGPTRSLRGFNSMSAEPEAAADPHDLASWARRSPTSTRWRTSIAQLNEAIKANTIAGLPVNDLKDQRDLLAEQARRASGAPMRPIEFGQVNVVPQRHGAGAGRPADTLTSTREFRPVLRWADRTTRLAAASRRERPAASSTPSTPTIPSYIAKPRHRRDDVARPGQRLALRHRRLDRGEGSGPERGGRR